MDDFIPFYPSINITHKNESIPRSNFSNLVMKREFRELTLPKKEEKPKYELLYTHQVLMSRLLSPITLINRLLIFHSAGSGKTYAHHRNSRRIY